MINIPKQTDLQQTTFEKINHIKDFQNNYLIYIIITRNNSLC